MKAGNSECKGSYRKRGLHQPKKIDRFCGYVSRLTEDPLSIYSFCIEKVKEIIKMLPFKTSAKIFW